MTKIFLTLIALCVVRIAYAQDSLMVTDNAKSVAIVSRLTRDLNLNETQQQKVYSIMENRWQAINESQTQNQGLSRQAVNDGTLNELEKVLTREQYQLFMILRKATQDQKVNYKRQNADYELSKEELELEF